jgi:TetR/AcrR family tetracycline transcriptional repressor
MLLLDEGGPSALSVRAVAGHLGVRPNAIYTYVTDRAELERAVVERVLSLADADLLGGPSRSWRRRATAYAGDLREVLLDHPGAAVLFMSAPMDGPSALLVGEGLIKLFVDAGLKSDEASRATYALIVHVLGSVALEVAETDGRAPLPSEDERVAQRYASLAQVPEDAFPWNARTARTAAEWITTAQFDWDIRLLLDGVAARVKRV